MPTTPIEIELSELTSTSPKGDGVFDKLMLTMRGHLDEEFKLNRIKGPEYATVYLGSLESVMASSMNFVMQRRTIALQAALLEQQTILAEIEVLKANISLQILEFEKQKAAASVDLINAQVQVTLQQKVNLAADVLNTPKQGLLIDAQAAVAGQQKINLAAELPKILAEVAEMESRSQLTAQQVLNMVAEGLNIPKQGIMLDKQAAVAAQQAINLNSENDGLLIKNVNTTAEGLNIPKQGQVLDAQVCKLQAEYDLTLSTTVKSATENNLMLQKVLTEKAQTTSMGVDEDSVVGKQKALYQAQKDGFTRDAEQKAAKMLIDTWSARRMSDEGTVADGVNKLNDATIGRTVDKLLAGINA